MASYDYVRPTGIFIHVFIRIGMYRNKANKKKLKAKYLVYMADIVIIYRLNLDDILCLLNNITM